MAAKSALVDALKIAQECVRTPRKVSVWSAELNRYVCGDDPEFRQAMADRRSAKNKVHPPLSPAFKLVFLTAAGGTILFVLMCLGVHLLTGGVMPSATEKFVDGMLDMAKIGFGAVVGLLGGQTLRNEVSLE
jgi:hypothetical protein